MNGGVLPDAEIRTSERSAPAKINLGLSVLARRGDGFHEIDSLLAALELHDTVRVAVQELSNAPEPAAATDRGTHADDITLEVEAPQGAGFTTEVPADERNLAWKAASAYREAVEAAAGPARRIGRIEITLTKRIPVAAGLGGGSSDAAAVLAALADLTSAPELDLDRLALELGSDVPFFLGLQQRRWTAARARGRGERLEVATVPTRWLVLVHPGVGVAAGEAYAALQNFSRRPDWDAVVAALETGGRPPWVNALQPGVLLAHPDVRTVLDALRTARDVDAALMSGSGSACFALARDEAHALGLARDLGARHPDWWVEATRLAGSVGRT